MRTKAILGWLCAGFLCIIYGLVLSAYGIFRFTDGKGFVFIPAVFAALAFAFVGCCLGVVRFCRKRRLDSRGYGRAALLAFFMIPVFFIMHDSPPMNDDYGIEDLTIQRMDSNRSYDTLMAFEKGGEATADPAMQLTAYAFLLADPLKNAETIDRAWETVVNARSLIERMDAFPEIYDWTSQNPIGWGSQGPDFRTLIHVGRTYSAHARLLTAKGHSEEAARHLAVFFRFARRAFPFSIVVEKKLLWSDIINDTQKTAFFILHHPRCSLKAVEIFKKTFTAIPEEDVHMRSVLIGQYIRTKQSLEGENEQDGYSNRMVRGICWVVPKPLSFVMEVVSVSAGRILFQKNRTIADLRHRFDLLIVGADKNPPDMSSADMFAREYDRNPGIRNTLGWFLVSTTENRFSKFSESFLRTKILSDLLAMESGAHTGRSVVLKDMYSGLPYKKDKQTGRVFSVGPDRISLTKDDISFETAPKNESEPSKRTWEKRVFL